ncbi:unnamed protein product (macronuclear) [Paramecium tetraurelia]|uniref:Uncharacterized protein n=1 Tax=Paramecium tetraurelia TaxID=5888 RepID=A0E6V4_PARTE|nr:uncharacterized protein GSPATT00023749001 [Paramecium tetraurelia]CAK91021.1 unnamed protein product [Paramecium tetraurelia]|eukprot:XP_001458418.1 hypothetical protein (macronuclear) [Paramecium tetraurelia strain d4-2]
MKSLKNLIKEYIMTRRKQKSKISFYNSIIIQLQTFKENLCQKTYTFGNFIDELRNILTPTQVAKVILGLEKYHKEFSVSNVQKQFEDEFDTIVKQEEWQFDDTVSKKVHI